MTFSKDMIAHVDPTFESVAPDERYLPHFKDRIGAIDGTHVPAIIFEEKKDMWYNRKGFISQNIMAACSFDLQFTFAVPGWEGSAHDARILRETLENPSLGFPYPPLDAGYSIQEGFLPPHRNTRYHPSSFNGERPNSGKEFFNKKHSSLRSCIERTFGVWKARWRILRFMPSYPFKVQVKIILATMALHNFIRRYSNDDPAFFCFETNLDFVPEDRITPTQEPTERSSNEVRGVSSQRMIALREEITENLTRNMRQRR
ncbi:unnamed protein product [Cuscuta europaea]|uniref:DDE Tnp4 domain-containing protein n=1 Tax=Cuscuta europaea TaxID=41803 RepID=A0A9P1EIE2_CUSEU|nr:unnamed protein product [Cuscuta europaea]